MCVSWSSVKMNTMFGRLAMAPAAASSQAIERTVLVCILVSLLFDTQHRMEGVELAL